MDKKTISLKPLKGKVLVFGGVYSNLQSLEALIKIAEKHKILPNQCFCTGDLVGYCSQPEETVQKFIKWGAYSIIGNVEQQLRNGKTNCGCEFNAGSRCDIFSKTWYPYAQSKLSESSINWMRTLPDFISFSLASKKITLVHGSYNSISEFIFKSSPWAVKEYSFNQSQSQVIIAGHCGLPFVDKNKHKLWINPGVIGMPANDGQTQVWYAVLDDAKGFSYNFKNLQYDYKKAYKLMLKSNLPQAYAKTLITGFWDNTEILPLKERLLTGSNLFEIKD
ncbi:MAG: metallophosphoesterase family protein [Tenacibaculum sp.]